MLQAASKSAFKSTGVLSITFDAASIGKPRKDLLLLAQYCPTTRKAMILPPQVMKMTKAQLESDEVHHPRSRIALTDNPLDEIVVSAASTKAARQINLEHLTALESALQRTNGFGLSAFLPARALEGLPPRAKRYFVPQTCKATGQQRNRATWL